MQQEITNLDKYFKTWFEKAKELNNKREELIRETISFYVDILKTLLKLGIDAVTFADYTVVDSIEKKYEIREAIIIIDKKPYYINFEREFKIPLKNERDLEDAIFTLFSEIIILRDHDKIIDKLKEEVFQSLSTKGEYPRKLYEKLNKR